jgi:hypothetical protein
MRKRRDSGFHEEKGKGSLIASAAAVKLPDVTQQRAGAIIFARIMLRARAKARFGMTLVHLEVFERKMSKR